MGAPRRHLTLTRLLTTALLIAVVGASSPVSASAATVGELKAQLEGVQRRYSNAGAAVDDAFDRLDQTDDRISDTQAHRKKALKELHAAQRVLARRARRMYRGGAVSPIAVLVGASTFDDFVTRMDYLKRIGNQDASAVANVKTKREALRKQERRLQAQRKARANDLAAVREKRADLERQLQSTSAEYERARRALAQARAAAAARSASQPAPASNVSVAPGPNGMVFPVAGPCYYSDTFGAARSGGRSHKGTDIMASSGVPVVAVVSGSVTAKTNGLGGKTIWLNGGGWSFYYAHLSGWAVSGGSVSAGQVIGYVGATGNASGGAPHLHFEMHPGGGDAVNPYPYLRNMQ